MPQSAILIDFRNAIALYKAFISRAYAPTTPAITQDEKEFIVESAFLRMFVVWESFLEKSFCAYMLGHPSTSGKLPVRYVTPLSADHCSKILIGTQKYVDWANPEILRKLTTLYLAQGDPLAQVIASIQADLFDLKTIRNAAAHVAGTTMHALDALASRKLNKQCNSIKVTDFIMSIDPSMPPATILDFYLNVIDTAAEQIATWK